MKKIYLLTKIPFHIFNIALIILYLFPGSILGWIVYNDFQKQPQLTSNFFVSSNHLYAFLIFATLGIFSFEKKRSRLLFIYLFSISLFLELCHLIIPERNFEYSDLSGNFLGVLLVFLVFKFYQYFKNKK
tara:strand:- start:349 stop:738 length:390 start_codon:yes stop_codon:yes gene_type:complete